MNQDFLQKLPIDIHINKLLDWLISRNHCKRNWFEKYNNLMTEIKEIISNDPNIKDIFENQGINVFTLETMKKTWRDSKFSKLIQFVDKLNEDGTGIAGAASELSRLMSGELITLNKNNKEFQKKISGLEKLVITKERMIETFPESYEKKCVNFGLIPKPIQELYDIHSYSLTVDQYLSQLWINIDHIYSAVKFFIDYIQKRYHGNISPDIQILTLILNDIHSDFNFPNTDQELKEKIKMHKHKILTDMSMRKELIVELTKILSFYKEFLLSKNNEIQEISFFDDDTITLDDSQCKTWIMDIGNILEKIESKSIVNALLMQSSLSYRHGIEIELDKMRKQYFEAINSKAKALQALEETKHLLQDNDKQFQSTVNKAKIIYEKMKERISSLYKERPVNFFSESNKFIIT